MLKIKSICFGKTYLVHHHDHTPESRRSYIFHNLTNSNTIHVNSFSSLMTNMTITNKAKEDPEKTLREYGTPTRHATRKPIRVDNVEVEEFEIKTELIIKVQELAFKR
jgi:hypothetical protein